MGTTPERHRAAWRAAFVVGIWSVLASFAEGCGGDSGQAVALPEEVFVRAGYDGTPDGSSDHPFASPAEAIEAIANAADWQGTLVVEKGRYSLTQELVLPEGVELEIRAGVRLAMGPDVSVHAQADVKVLGVEDDPVVFTWLEEGKHWGSLTNFEPDSEDNVFEWATFEHGYESNFKGIAMRGALSLNGAKARISHCTFRENEGDDGLNLKRSSTLVEHSTFEDNVSDALDADGEGAPEVRFSTFTNNGNDGVDLGEGTKPYVHDNVIIGQGDKGISNGEASAARIEHNLIVGCGVGIGVKDDADPVMRYNTLYGNDYGLRVFQEDTSFGGGKGRFEDGIIWGSMTEDILFEFGETTFAYSCIERIVDDGGSPVVEGEGLKTVGSGCDDPMFVDADALDFHLASESGHWDEESSDWTVDDRTSPCIDAGDPAADLGEEPAPNGSVVNVGVYGGTAQASKSP